MEVEKNKSLVFWDLISSSYDEYVLGKNAPREIRVLEEAEDTFFDLVLKEHIEGQKRTVFLELGSGTGRYLLRSLNNVFTYDHYNRFLAHIIGIDFSLKMIEKSITNIENHVPRLAEIMEVDQPTARRRVQERLSFVNADVRKHYLSVEGDVLTLVGLMFGTLGNIPMSHHDAVLSRIKTLIDHGGECIITVFNAEAHKIGQSTYGDLKGLVGHKLEWNSRTKTFTTLDRNFYSHWFNEGELDDLLRRNGFGEILESRSIGERGISVRISTPRGMNKILKFSGKKAEIFLLCPDCSQKLCPIPIPRRRSVKCHGCSARYMIKDIHGFRVPVLVMNK